MYCQEHEPAAAAANPYTAPPAASPYAAPYAPTPGAPSPGLAFVLGLIPGVGAIYNGQYAKGVIHVILLGILISIVSSDSAHGFEPLFGMLIPLLFFYMAFEAYHTAAKRLRGEPVDEFSSIFPVGRAGRGFPIGPILLILWASCFFLKRWISSVCTKLCRYWPVFLILLGCYMLYIRLRGDEPAIPAEPEVSNER